MRTYTLAGVVILLIVGCTPDGESTATQGDATTTRDVSADSSSDILPNSVPLGGACELDTHCRESEAVCKSGVCTVVACDTDDQCEGKQFCDYYCIRSVGPGEVCSRDEACPTDYICDALHCAKRTCRDRSECGSAGRVCTLDGLCDNMQCWDHSDCDQDSGEMGCFGGLCLPPSSERCLSDTHCDPTQICNKLYNKCIDNPNP